jgi:competence protein ComEC
VGRLREALALGWPTLLVVAACLGLAAANWAQPPALVLAVIAGAGAVGVVQGGERARLAVLGASLAALGLWWGSLRVEALERSVLAGRIGDIEPARVVVQGPPSVTRFAVRAPGEVRTFGGLTLRERVLLELPEGRAPPQGAILALRARPVAPRGPETGFDERGWLARRGVHVVLHASGPWRVVGRRGGIGGVGDRLRTEITDALALGTSGERRALVTGVVLGADEGIDPALRDAFKASGLYHLLAVSGQNVVLIAFGVLGLAYVAGIARAWGHVLAIAAVLGYALAVGWQPSVVRAAIAGCVASLAWLASRPSDRWHVLALGALVLLAWTPRSLLEPGFQLSFAAVAAILLTVPRLRRWHEGWPLPWKLIEIVGISGACGLVTAPILWLQFGVVPLWTVPANALAEPAMPLLLGFGLAAAVVAPVLPAAAVALSWLAGLCAAWLAFSARLVASLPHAQVSSPLVFAIPIAVIGACAALRRLPAYRRRGAVIDVTGLVVLAAVAWWALHPPPRWQPPAGLRVTFLDVGQGDGILLEVPEGAMLVDTGPPEAHIDRQLRRMGIGSLAAVLITHPHRDHVGGAPDVLRHISVGELLDPLQPGTWPEDAEARQRAADHRARLVAARAGSDYRLGRLRIHVLWPDGGGLAGEDPHAHGVVLLASYGATDLLLTGDSESDVTSRLPLRPVEVLKVAHHGSSDPGLSGELRMLRPRVAVISVGKVNDYGHPRADTLSTLAAVPGLSLYRTDLNGRVVVESDGRTLTVRSARGVP